MPKINDSEYQAAEAMTGGGEYKKMGAGGYVCRIQAVRTHGKNSSGREVDYVAENQYVRFIWDVDEGEFAGKFSDEYWTDKDYAHQLFFSWKNLGALKGNIQALDESNPGFDAKAAFDADKWEMFVGKQIGLVLGEEEYLGNDGTVKTRFGFPRMKSVHDIRAGKFKVPPLKKLDGGTSTASTPASPGGKSVYDEDLPF